MQALLMGGQACVFYGAAQVSKDVDFVQAKKTQRSKDWPIIERLVTIHYRENGASPRADWMDASSALAFPVSRNRFRIGDSSGNQTRRRL